MKTVLATAALAAIVLGGSPVRAQSIDEQPAAFQAFAQAQPQTRIIPRRRTPTFNGRHSDNPAYDVYDGPNYVGSDPDAFIRNDLVRDQNRGD